MKIQKLCVGIMIAVLVITAVTTFFWAIWPRPPMVLGDLKKFHSNESALYGGDLCADFDHKGIKGSEDCNVLIKKNLYDQLILYQSRRSAYAAESALNLSYNQSVIGLVGVIFSFAALLSAILASLFSGWAAHQAKRSVDISLISQRAWLSIKDVKIVSVVESGSALFYRFEIILKNVGVIPAKNIQLDAWGDVWPLSQEWALEKYSSVVLGRDIYQGYVLAPNEEGSFGLAFSIDIKRESGVLRSHGIAIAASYLNPGRKEICQTCRGMWIFNKNGRHSYFEKDLTVECMLSNTAGHMSYAS